MRSRVTVGLLGFLIAAAVLVTALSGRNYATQDRDSPMAGASRMHWTGTDDLGRDRTIRMAVALLIGAAGAVAASAVSVSLAAGIGTAAAFSPRPVGGALMLLSDIFLALPWLFLLMIVRSALPLTISPMRSAAVTFFILAALGWPACARAVYRGALDLRCSEWMNQGRAAGLSSAQLIRGLLPHLRPLLVPQFLLCIPAFLVAEANMGALGLGIAEPLPSWGGMLMELDNSAMLARSGWVYFPIALLVGLLLLLESLVHEV
jgi:ABC-type dipeptide/oligopeptide/nickel transport system permease subunit